MAKMLVINKENKEKAEQIFENLKNSLITFEEIKSFFDCDDNQAMEYNKVFENMYHLFYYSDLISNSYLASHVFEDEKINLWYHKIIINLINNIFKIICKLPI